MLFLSSGHTVISGVVALVPLAIGRLVLVVAVVAVHHR